MRLQTSLYLILLFCNCNQRADKSKEFEKKSNQLVLKSKTLLDNNQLDSAQVYLQNALSLDPNNYAAYNNRAILKFKLNFPPESIIVDFEKSLEIKHDYDDALYSLTNYYFEIKDYQNAIKAADDYFMFARVVENDSAMTKHILLIKKTSKNYAKMIDGVSVSRAISYYDSINFVHNETKLHQQRYIDKITMLIQDIRNFRQIQVTNAELKQLLDSAKKMGQLRFSKIENITEIDSNVNLKHTVLVYTSKFNVFYKLCSDYLANLEKIKQVGLFIIGSKIVPKLAEIKEAEKDYLRVRNEFKIKYGFTVPDK